jgi:hypothetical protein
VYVSSIRDGRVVLGDREPSRIGPRFLYPGVRYNGTSLKPTQRSPQFTSLQSVFSRGKKKGPPLGRILERQHTTRSALIAPRAHQGPPSPLPPMTFFEFLENHPSAGPLFSLVKNPTQTFSHTPLTYLQGSLKFLPDDI